MTYFPEHQRLPMIVEKRQRGWTTDPGGMPMPKMVGYHIGHGQQISAKRLASIRVNVSSDVLTRQIVRHLARRKAKHDARQARAQAVREGKITMQARRRARLERAKQSGVVGI